jgi:Ca2+-binding EF-hand superfamily protein
LKLELAEFKSLFDIAYKERLVPEQIRELFDLLDEEKKGYLNLENFFGVVDLIENNKNLTKKKYLENRFIKK